MGWRRECANLVTVLVLKYKASTCGTLNFCICEGARNVADGSVVGHYDR